MLRDLDAMMQKLLTVIDELDKMGISIRFADYPDLNPIDLDDRILLMRT